MKDNNTILRIIPEADRVIFTFMRQPGNDEAGGPDFVVGVGHDCIWEIVDDVIGILQNSPARRTLWQLIKETFKRR